MKIVKKVNEHNTIEINDQNLNREEYYLGCMAGVKTNCEDKQPEKFPNFFFYCGTKKYLKTQ